MAADGVVPGAGSVLAELAAALTALAAVGPDALSDAELVTVLAEVHALESRLHAVQVSWLAASIERGATVAVAGRGPRSWLIEQCRLTAPEASKRLRLAHGLAGAAATACALAAGEITSDHAALIVGVLRTIPAEAEGDVEAALLDLARQHPPFLVARAVDQIRVLFGVDPDADAAAERRYGRRGVSVATTFAGMGSLDGTLTAETAETLRRALEAAAGAHDPADTRTVRQRTHDALADIASFYLSHAESADVAGERPRVIVTMSLQTLLDELSARAATLSEQWATLGSGVAIGPQTARRLACDAEIIPAVLGSAGEVLDLGRATRVWSASIRRAAKLRDGFWCAFAKCGRRPADLHHMQWWSAGGATSLDNAAWLCLFHHRLVHEGGWSMTRAPDGAYHFEPPKLGFPSARAPDRHSAAA